MVLLRAGIALFVSVTLVSTAMMWGIFYISSPGYWPEMGNLQLAWFLMPVTLLTCILLLVLARRGRRQALTDGIASITVLVLVGSLGIVANGFATHTGQFPDSTPMFTWVIAGIAIASLVPAYVACYLALSQTPLLRPLTSQPE